MTDREEREKVIEILQKEKKTALHDNRWAFDYAIASIKTDLKYDLLYEGVDCNNCKNNLHRGDGSIYCATGDGICHYECEEPTTKNDLVVDWENYKDVDGNSLDDLILEVLQNNFDCGNTYGYKVADEIIELLPSATPQEPKTGHCKNCKFFELNSWAACGGIPIIVAHEICKAWGKGCKTKEDGYCFLFEPKESEVEE